jgi:hypothetical protein
MQMLHKVGYTVFARVVTRIGDVAFTQLLKNGYLTSLKT